MYISLNRYLLLLLLLFSQTAYSFSLNYHPFADFITDTDAKLISNNNAYNTRVKRDRVLEQIDHNRFEPEEDYSYSAYRYEKDGARSNSNGIFKSSAKRHAIDQISHQSQIGKLAVNQIATTVQQPNASAAVHVDVRRADIIASNAQNVAVQAIGVAPIEPAIGPMPANLVADEHGPEPAVRVSSAVTDENREASIVPMVRDEPNEPNVPNSNKTGQSGASAAGVVAAVAIGQNLVDGLTDAGNKLQTVVLDLPKHTVIASDNAQASATNLNKQGAKIENTVGNGKIIAAGLTIAAVSGLAAYYLYQKNQKFKNFVDTTATKIKNGFNYFIARPTISTFGFFKSKLGLAA